MRCQITFVVTYCDDDDQSGRTSVLWSEIWQPMFRRWSRFEFTQPKGRTEKSRQDMKGSAHGNRKMRHVGDPERSIES